MVLSSFGDIILMDFKPITTKVKIRGFVSGAVTFMISHIVYSSAFLIEIIDKKLKFPNNGTYFVLFILIISLIFLLFLHIRNKQRKVKMLVVGLVYLSIICTNLALISSYAFEVGGLHLLCALGALSFFISDVFIGVSVVGNIKSQTLKSLIWVFYPIGQILIILFS